jgi:hypothetical protein
MKTLGTVLILATLTGCASVGDAPSATQRIADAIACEAAAVQLIGPITSIIADSASADAAKANSAQAALDKANALPACIKVGANAVQVVAAQKAARDAMKNQPAPVK